MESTASAASLEKGLALFDRIARDGGTTPLADLARDMALPRATLYRLVGALERGGLVARVGRSRYDIGLKLVDRLHGRAPAAQLARIARPHLRRLARLCRATAHLGVMENDMVTYLVKESAGTVRSTAPFTHENAQLEAYCSGIGRVLLAWLPEAAREEYLANGPFVALTPRTITDPAALRQCLIDTHAHGFARDDHEVADTLYCLAVPLPMTDGQVTAAISLSFTHGENERAGDSIWLEKLHACAGRIGTALV